MGDHLLNDHVNHVGDYHVVDEHVDDTADHHLLDEHVEHQHHSPGSCRV